MIAVAIAEIITGNSFRLTSPTTATTSTTAKKMVAVVSYVDAATVEKSHVATQTAVGQGQTVATLASTMVRRGCKISTFLTAIMSRS